MYNIKELCRLRISNDGYHGIGTMYHIRYDFNPDFVRELCEDEKKMEEFLEQIKKDISYRLKSSYQIDRYVAEDVVLTKTLLEQIKGANGGDRE